MVVTNMKYEHTLLGKYTMNLSVKETSNQNQKQEIGKHIFEHIGDSDCYLTWRNEVSICSAYYAEKYESLQI